ncbi:MAG: hypothetical protein WBB84_02985, partial [Candidatus Omnitrophota bacterium]
AKLLERNIQDKLNKGGRTFVMGIEDGWKRGNARRTANYSFGEYTLEGALGLRNFIRRMREGKHAYRPFYDKGKKARIRALDTSRYVRGGGSIIDEAHFSKDMKEFAKALKENGAGEIRFFETTLLRIFDKEGHWLIKSPELRAALTESLKTLDGWSERHDTGINRKNIFIDITERKNGELITGDLVEQITPSPDDLFFIAGRFLACDEVFLEEERKELFDRLIAFWAPDTQRRESLRRRIREGTLYINRTEEELLATFDRRLIDEIRWIYPPLLDADVKILNANREKEITRAEDDSGSPGTTLRDLGMLVVAAAGASFIAPWLGIVVGILACYVLVSTLADMPGFRKKGKELKPTPAAGIKVMVAVEEQLRNTIKRSIKKIDGLKICETTDGQKALEMFRANREEVSIVILTEGLADADVYALAKQIKAAAPETYIIMLGGSNANATAQQLQKEGVLNCYLHGWGVTDLRKEIEKAKEAVRSLPAKKPSGDERKPQEVVDRMEDENSGQPGSGAWIQLPLNVEPKEGFDDALVIGSLNSNWEALMKLLAAGNCLDEKGNLTAEKRRVIIGGNELLGVGRGAEDRGKEHELQKNFLERINTLQQKAKKNKHGVSNVTRLIGDKELEILLCYASEGVPDEISAARKQLIQNRLHLKEEKGSRWHASIEQSERQLRSELINNIKAGCMKIAHFENGVLFTHGVVLKQTVKALAVELEAFLRKDGQFFSRASSSSQLEAARERLRTCIKKRIADRSSVRLEEISEAEWFEQILLLVSDPAGFSGVANDLLLYSADTNDFFSVIFNIYFGDSPISHQGVTSCRLSWLKGEVELPPVSKLNAPGASGLQLSATDLAFSNIINVVFNDGLYALKTGLMPVMRTGEKTVICAETGIPSSGAPSELLLSIKDNNFASYLSQEQWGQACKRISELSHGAARKSAYISKMDPDVRVHFLSAFETRITSGLFVKALTGENVLNFGMSDEFVIPEKGMEVYKLTFQLTPAGEKYFQMEAGKELEFFIAVMTEPAESSEHHITDEEGTALSNLKELTDKGFRPYFAAVEPETKIKYGVYIPGNFQIYGPKTGGHGTTSARDLGMLVVAAAGASIISPLLGVIVGMLACYVIVSTLTDMHGSRKKGKESEPTPAGAKKTKPESLDMARKKQFLSDNPPSAPVGLRILHKFVAPFRPYEMYSLHDAPALEEKIFTLVPFAILSTLLATGVLGLYGFLGGMAFVYATFVALHAGNIWRAPPEVTSTWGKLRYAFKAPLSVAGFNMLTSTVFGWGLNYMVEGLMPGTVIAFFTAFFTWVAYEFGRMSHKQVNKKAVEEKDHAPAGTNNPNAGFTPTAFIITLTGIIAAGYGLLKLLPVGFLSSWAVRAPSISVLLTAALLLFVSLSCFKLSGQFLPPASPPSDQNTSAAGIKVMVAVEEQLRNTIKRSIK